MGLNTTVGTILNISIQSSKFVGLNPKMYPISSLSTQIYLFFIGYKAIKVIRILEPHLTSLSEPRLLVVSYSC